MKLTVVQFAPIFGEKEKNIASIKKFIDNNNTDVIVFPELSTTGYDFIDYNELKNFAEPFNGETINYFSDIAVEQNKIIVLGFAEKDGEDLFNSAAVLFPNKKLNTVYRKIHLFFRERFYFTEGNKGFFNIYDAKRDINIAPMICYDWRFPEAARTLALSGADLIVCPSNLVTNVWHLVTPARAIENKVYLAVANRIGSEKRSGDELIFNGQSVIHSYNGTNLVQANQNETVALTTEIEPANTRKKSFNEYNDIFKDRRVQYYK